MKSAFITGISGQVGSYLAELLIEKGYEVNGLVRRTSHNGRDRIAHLEERIRLYHGDVTDNGSIIRAFELSKPSEIYHLAAQSFVGTSWNEPTATAMTTGFGAVNVLEAAKQIVPTAKVMLAGSSEMFGNNAEGTVCNESTPFAPISPYGAAKVFAHNMGKIYRQSYGMKVFCPIAFNHESPRRGPEFVTKKIVSHVARVATGFREKLRLGRLDPRRDFSFAGDIAGAYWRLLQYEEPQDIILGSGEAHSIEDFVREAFGQVGLDWLDWVTIDKTLYRPTEIYHLQADPSKAKELLGWKAKVSFKELVKMMVDAELARVSITCN